MVVRAADPEHRHRLQPPAARPVEKQNRILVLAGRWPHKRTDLALDYLARWQKQTDFPGTVEWVGNCRKVCNCRVPSLDVARASA